MTLAQTAILLAPDMTFAVSDHPHRRFDPLADRWVMVSPHRAKRPWLGAEDAPDPVAAPAYDPNCYLCPGNRRASGEHNPDYAGPYVFANDFPAILPGHSQPPIAADVFSRCEAIDGEARVLCYSPDHSMALGQLDRDAMTAVVDCWCAQSGELGARFANVQIFENRGAMMGASNPHPHGQIWATAHLPDIVLTEDRTQQAWAERHGAPLLLALASSEHAAQLKVEETEFWVSIVPFWAAWPFETLVLPKFPVQRLDQLSPPQRRDLGDALRGLIGRYDALFGCPFPYSMGWHGAPSTQDDAAHWQLHAHFYPPLLRSATVRKFMVGYELLAEPQRDLTPEQAADRLRSVPIGSRR